MPPEHWLPILPFKTIVLLLVAQDLRWHRYKDKKIGKRRAASRYKHLLFKALGGKCKQCGEFFDLTIDHIDGRTWDARHWGPLDRWRRYYHEYTGENPRIKKARLRLLCRRCNGKWDPWKKRWR